MKIIEKENSVIVENVRDFNIVHIFECGQCFRWEKIDNDSYLGIIRDKVIIVRQKPEQIEFINVNEKEFRENIIDYFDLNRDYTKIKNILQKDKVMETAINFAPGIRILKQDLWECIVSFIISANNRIPMIKKTVQNISKNYGSEILFNNKKYYTFPTSTQLQNCTEEDFAKCGAGFRAKYIKAAVDMVTMGHIDINKLKDLSTPHAKEELQKIPGIGPKVSDCILLFALGRYEVFPVDVWVKRVMEHFYSPNGKYRICDIQDVAKSLFDDLAGFAQQYLFYYAREMKIGK